MVWSHIAWQFYPREGDGTCKKTADHYHGLHGKEGTMPAYAREAVIEPGGVCPRFERSTQTLLSTKVHLCPERAILITTFFKKHDNPREPMVIRRARALRYLLEHKDIKIYPDELIAGNMGTHRISAIMQPELASVFMSEELLWIDKRRTTPFEMAWRERLRLLVSVHPYWLARNMALKAFFPRIHTMARYVAEQLNATYYLINEAGGIGHFLPHYEKMLKLGLRGYLAALDGRGDDFHRAARIACEGLAAYALRVAATAQRLSEQERDPGRAAELGEIARICRKVPMDPPETLQEALQALWLTHMAVNLEGLNSAISFGRIDQYLYPYYQADLDAGRITPDEARELLLLFSAKAVEHVFLLTERTSQYHGGDLVVQAAIIGGLDKAGRDATNPLTYLFLDVMERFGLRDPNYQARVHKASPPAYVQRVVDVARKGSGMPAIFGDEAAIGALTSHGYPLEEARNYAVVGCVELSLPGKSFFSTDAALFNLPLCLELALNRGRRFGKHRRLGAETPDPATFTSIDRVIEAFRDQVEFMVRRMIADLKVMERGNRDYHPTPFSSLLIDGCLETGKDVTAGGAMYNSSGVQGVGIADVADSLAALQEVVFTQKKYPLLTVIEAMKNNFAGDEVLRAALLKAPKFGNDQPLPDDYAIVVGRRAGRLQPGPLQWERPPGTDGASEFGGACGFPSGHERLRPEPAVRPGCRLRRQRYHGPVVPGQRVLLSGRPGNAAQRPGSRCAGRRPGPPGQIPGAGGARGRILRLFRRPAGCDQAGDHHAHASAGVRKQTPWLSRKAGEAWVFPAFRICSAAIISSWL